LAEELPRRSRLKKKCCKNHETVSTHHANLACLEMMQIYQNPFKMSKIMKQLQQRFQHSSIACFCQEVSFIEDLHAESYNPRGRGKESLGPLLDTGQSLFMTRYRKGRRSIFLKVLKRADSQTVKQERSSETT
jgi:hypothetical protein